jgi:UDP-N-acetyl-alpha-D-muramoyl-L-alanyl-L-glutamate epimerase
MRRISIERIARSRSQLAFLFRADDLRFSTSVWYEGLDLDALDGRTVDRLAAHLAAIELTKLVSLRPDEVDLGPAAFIHTARFETLWRTIVRKVWAQWRWEHDLPAYEGPAFVHTPRAPEGPISVPPGDLEVLSFCGGGKDSLVALRLLDGAHVPHASLAYSHSVYGAAAPQHALIDGLLAHLPPARRERIHMFDDFLDAPIVELRPDLGVKRLLAAETPASLFAALPLALARGYRHIVLAHERSANVGNLVWKATGEDVNHQWGKSLEAERLLGDYISEELLGGVRYWSILQPVYDPVIFRLLRRDLGAVPSTHSCNVRKPWCRRCAKCAYVWLGYMAHLPRELVDGMFGENLFDAAENAGHFRAMLGLEAHTPFECIGEVDETRLAFALCERKGVRGHAMDVFQREVPRLDLAALCARYLDVGAPSPSAPAEIMTPVLAQMREAAEAARTDIMSSS